MTDTRRCVGSTRFGIEAHAAPIEDFSAQPSQKDRLSRMCTTHWRQYVAGLARGAKERNAAAATEPAPGVAGPAEPARKRTRTRPTVVADVPVAQEGRTG